MSSPSFSENPHHRGYAFINRIKSRNARNNVRRHSRGDVMSVKRVILHVELKLGEAAGLKRLADKTGWSEAMAILSAHRSRNPGRSDEGDIARAGAYP